MIISAELFLDCIFLLIHNCDIRNIKAVTKLIEIYDEESKSNTTLDNEVTLFYIRVIKLLLSGAVDRTNVDELRMFLIKFKSDPVLETRRDIYDLLYDAFMSRNTLTPERLAEFSDRVQNALVWHLSHRATRKLYGSVNKCSELVNVEDQRQQLLNISRYAQDIVSIFDETEDGDNKPAGMVDCITFSDKASILKGLEKHTSRNVTGVIHMGLQGLNQMLGKARGAVRGESIVFCALLHNYKSGMLSSVAMWCALYNTPKSDSGKKPLVLWISLENEAHQNMYWVFRQQYHMQTGKSPDGMSNDEIAGWIYDLFAQNGLELVIERYLPEAFGYEEIKARVQHFEKKGYEVYSLIIDYLSKARTGTDHNASGAGNHLLLKELYSRTCNYLKSKGITLFTAHQLTRKAQEIANSGATNIVKRFGSEHMADAIDVAREVDCIINLHLERSIDGTRFLTMQIDKHRYVDDTPEAHKYCAYPFTPLGIIDDIHQKQPGFTRDIFAYTSDHDNPASSGDIF